MNVVRSSRIAKTLTLGVSIVLASAMLATPARAATEITFQTNNAGTARDMWGCTHSRVYEGKSRCNHQDKLCSWWRRV